MMKVALSLGIASFLFLSVSTTALAGEVKEEKIYSFETPSDSRVEIPSDSKLIKDIVGTAKVDMSNYKILSTDKNKISSPYVVVGKIKAVSSLEASSNWKSDIAANPLYKALPNTVSLQVENYNMDFISGKSTSNIKILDKDGLTIPRKATSVIIFNGGYVISASVIFDIANVKESTEVFTKIYQSLRTTSVAPIELTVDRVTPTLPAREIQVAIHSDWKEISAYVLSSSITFFLLGKFGNRIKLPKLRRNLSRKDYLDT